MIYTKAGAPEQAGIMIHTKAGAPEPNLTVMGPPPWSTRCACTGPATDKNNGVKHNRGESRQLHAFG
jgi:hypothetical protein